MRSFRQGKIWVLICTELLGRGIDFKGVNLVINYDFPLSGISYVHRIGRCGRAGRLGRAVTFFTDDELPYLKRIVNIVRDAGCRVPEYMLELKSNKNKLDEIKKEKKMRKRGFGKNNKKKGGVGGKKFANKKKIVGTKNAEKKKSTLDEKTKTTKKQVAADKNGKSEKIKRKSEKNLKNKKSTPKTKKKS